MNLKKKNQALTYENDSIYEEKEIFMKSTKTNIYSKTDVTQHNTPNYNLISYSKNVSPVLKSKKVTNENISTEKIDHFVTEEVFLKDQRYMQLLDKYNALISENNIVKSCVKDYIKGFEILANVATIQKDKINELESLNKREKERFERDMVYRDKEKESLSRQNIFFKSIIIKIYNKISSIEHEEKDKTQTIADLSLQIVKENEYLRKGMESVLGNSVIREVIQSDNKAHKNIVHVKKKRNPTQINFDFLGEDFLENNKVEEENIEENLQVDKLVKDFKIIKKSKTIKVNPSGINVGEKEKKG